MKTGTAFSLVFAFGVLALNGGCRSFRAAVQGKFQSGTAHMSVFDVTVTQEHPPAGSTAANIEVRSGASTSPTNVIGSVTSHDLTEWSGTFSDSAYMGESNYYVEIVVVYLPGLQTEVALLKFSSILGGVWLTGAELRGSY